MIGFLKSFLKGDKTPEEQALYAANELQRKRDVLVLDTAGLEAEEEDDNSCAAPRGCGGCGCG